MKKYLIFTILLLNSFSKSYACGYSPCGEDIRYSLFKPHYFKYTDFYSFNYNADLWGYDSYLSKNKQFEYESNIYDWYNYTGKEVSIESIVDFNNNLKISDINTNSNNEFLNFLLKNKRFEVIKYLTLSKRCENSNLYSDYSTSSWEREAPAKIFKENNFYDELFQAYNFEKNKYLKRKYAFQCIRRAFYLGKLDSVKSIFETQFKDSNKDYLYYWSLYFNCFAKKDDTKMVDIANIMANCPEKTFPAYFYFHQDFNLKTALKLTKNKDEIANIYAYASIQKVDKNLDYLKEIYNNKPNSRILDFLILREINKIEDWVYTPYYSNYLPSIEASEYYSIEQFDKVTTLTLRARSEKDRLYAQEMLDFVNSIDFNKVKNVVLWKATQIQLLFLTKKYSDCVSKCNQFEKTFENESILNQIEQIRALSITANQKQGEAVIKDEIKPIILKNLNNERFLFTLGRELEFKGNITDAVILFSFLENSYYESYGLNDDVEWQGNRLKNSGNLDNFYGYFDYLDFVYSANELQTVIDNLNTKNKTDFDRVITKKILKDKNYLIDLLGTKYIREEKFNEALKTFQSLGDAYWNNNYNAWERDKYNANYLFDQNPFYTLKYTNEFIEHKEKFIVTKLSVTEHLIKFSKIANNKLTKDRDYYYFLLANCFQNMTSGGNSWMMRRYGSSYSDNQDESYVDEREYQMGLKATEYYKLAYKNAKTEKFKALCLRMIGETETLKSKYPNYYKNLTSDCTFFEEYFNARRKI